MMKQIMKIGVWGLLLLFQITFAAAQSIELDKTTFIPGDKIRISFSAPAGYPDNAWIGIIPSGVPHGDEAVNDRHDLSYQYLQKKTSGTLTFTAPSGEGDYDFRMHDSDNKGQEVASVTFRVAASGKTGSNPSGSGKAELRLSKNRFLPGEAIQVHFVSPADFPGNAWIGIIPSGVPHGEEAVNDQHDLSYQYLQKKTSGTLTFTAPAQEGDYDFRMHDTNDNGREILSVSFTVASSPASSGESALRLGRTGFRPGETIQIHFTASADYADNAWIGIIPSGVPHGDEAVNDRHDLSYQYLKKKTSGTLTFTAPAQEGSYDFRMHDTDNKGRETASITFQVRQQ